MSRRSSRNSFDEDAFSAANSFDEIGDEIADERTHDFDEVDDSLDEAADRYADKRLPEGDTEELDTDLGPSDVSDSQKGTYHVLSTTVPRVTAPPPPPPPPPAPPAVLGERQLGTITTTALTDSLDRQLHSDTQSESDTEYGLEDSLRDPIPAPVHERDLTAETVSSIPEERRAVSYRGHDTDDDTQNTAFTFGVSPFAGVTTPSGRYHTHRLSGRNVGDALTSIWDRFWSDDMRKIVRIFRHRFKELVPHIRRFLAHLVAFWGGVTYIRRALSAFVRLLQRDDRVRDLLHRLGWASGTTLRVFCSLCAMVLQASLQFYALMRDRIIPQMRRVIPKCYYKSIRLMLNVARNSPWELVLGPFSVTAAVDRRKIPDPYLLHHKFGVPEDDTSFDFGTNTFANSTFFSARRAFSRGAAPVPRNDPHLRDSTFREQPTVESDVRTVTKGSDDFTVSSYGGKENDYRDREDVSSLEYRDF